MNFYNLKRDTAMSRDEIINWLLDGDVAIQYQVFRDLLGIENDSLQERISYEGWGKRYLEKRKQNGHWGDRFYQPKWISTHYTLLDLRNLNLTPDNPLVHESLTGILTNHKARDGGIRLGPSTSYHSDVCVNGMFLNYASYFRCNLNDIQSVVDCILDQIMPDGGFNYITQKEGSVHSSLHSTLSVVEGFSEFLKAGYKYRGEDIHKAVQSASEFILTHRLFLTDRTAMIINNAFLKFFYPCRWKYDIMRALDYFQMYRYAWDERMRPAIDIVLKKRNKDGRWIMPSPHPGKTHFEMETSGKPGRWNTLRAMRVLKHFKIEY